MNDNELKKQLSQPTKYIAARAYSIEDEHPVIVALFVLGGIAAGTAALACFLLWPHDVDERDWGQVLHFTFEVFEKAWRVEEKGDRFIFRSMNGIASRDWG